MIDHAIRLAQNEHVVYFLLTSYLYARERDRRGARVPPRVKRLPIAGKSDVRERLCALHAACGGDPADPAHTPRAVKEAMDVLHAASERIESL